MLFPNITINLEEKKMEYSNSAKILIADENPAQRQALRDTLARNGYRFIDEASNGEDALIKISRTHPDVVLIDIWLSKLDGIGVIRNTRSIDFGTDRAPSFIVVSMVSNQSIFIEATNAGAEMCILKPYDQISLCNHIKDILRGRNKSLDATDEIKNSDPDIETQVTKIIHQIGVPAHIKGYQYLRTAILLTIKDSDVINSVTKVL